MRQCVDSLEYERGRAEERAATVRRPHSMAKGYAMDPSQNRLHNVFAVLKEEANALELGEHVYKETT